MALLQTDFFERSVAAQTPQKYQGARDLLFLNNFFFGRMQIGLLSSELAGVKEARCAGGGLPLTESYSL